MALGRRDDDALTHIRPTGNPQEGGEFKKAAPEEIAKRRIVKARRGGAVAPAAATSDAAASTEASSTAKPAAGGFSWTTPAASKGSYSVCVCVCGSSVWDSRAVPLLLFDFPFQID